MTEDEQEEAFRLRAENVFLRQQVAAMTQRSNLYRFGSGTARQSGDHIQPQIPVNGVNSTRHIRPPERC